MSAANHQVGNMEHYRANDGDTGRFDELQVQTSQVYVGIGEVAGVGRPRRAPCVRVAQ